MASNSAAPKSFHSPAVAEFNISIPEYLRLNASISRLIVGAVIFSGDQVLLIQRAANDFSPLIWEVPGGSCEADKDATVLDTLARELWEETGLRLHSVKRLVDEADFDDSRKPDFTWRKITFEVEVNEGYGLGLSESKDAISNGVKLDPAEHQDWGWVSMAEIEGGEWEKGRLQLLELQHRTLLAAFKTRT